MKVNLQKQKPPEKGGGKVDIMNTKPIYAIETIYGEDYKVRAENEKQALKICGARNRIEN